MIGNPRIRIYVNKVSITIVFKTKKGYCLKHVTPGALKLPEGTKTKINKDENSKN